MLPVPEGDITRTVQRFLDVQEGGEPSPTSRLRSWDYCYNYFQAHPKPTQNIETSCLQLGYYLASWGMLRGSTYLFRETNAAHYVGAIRVIEELNSAMRSIDADCYSEAKARQRIVDAYGRLRIALLPKGGSAVTLVGKVMLGVWGNVPSFDTYFRKGFGELTNKRGEKTAFAWVNDHSLALLGDFHDQHHEEISNIAREHTTLGFDGQPTGLALPRAKIIDMYGFKRGYGG